MSLGKAAAIVLTLLLGAGLAACADRERLQADRMAQQAAQEAEDEAACSDRAEPGTQAHDACREGLARSRAEKAALQEQKRRDFDRVLGTGTSSSWD